jgi:pyruvate,water dikinase
MTLLFVGMLIPNGFAITAHAYRYFVEKAGLHQRIQDALTGLDKDNVEVRCYAFFMR